MQFVLKVFRIGKLAKKLEDYTKFWLKKYWIADSVCLKLKKKHFWRFASLLMPRKLMQLLTQVCMFLMDCEFEPANILVYADIQEWELTIPFSLNSKLNAAY